MNLYPLFVIVGPLLLGAVLAWALFRNRTSARRKADTEAATRDLYAREDAVAHRDGAVDKTPLDRPHP